MTAALYRLHIRLDQVEPKVEREFIVPSGLRLDRLHRVVQTVMGWEDCHLHQYIVGNRRNARHYGPKGDGSFGFDDQSLDERAHTLAQIAPRKGSRFGYWYDFGDDWHHTITVADALDHAPTPAPLQCLGATGACPPEDCGGPPGYARLLDALADPGHEEHDDLREWVGDGFDPAACDIAAVNAALARFARRWKLAPARAADAGAVQGRAASTTGTPARKPAAKPARAAAPPLHLDQASALAFIDTYKAVLLDIAGPVPEDGDINRHLVDARNLLAREPGRLDAAIARLRAAGRALDDDVLQAMRDLRLQRWIYLRDTRSHSVFLDPEGLVAYGALGLTQRIRDLTGQSGMFVETALLAWHGRIVCDALVSPVALLGTNLRRECTAALSEARAAGRYSSQTLFPRIAGAHDRKGGEDQARRDAAPARDRRPQRAPAGAEAPPRADAPHPDLFDPRAAGAGAGDLVAIATPGTPATREQKTFNRLIGQIQRKREELADWQTWLTGHAERVAAEYQPLQRRQYDVELRLARRLDAVLEPGSGARLRKPQRETFRRYLGERIHELLDAEGPAEDELATLLRKHTGDDIDALREEERQFEKELAETMLGDIFGEDLLDGHQGDDADSLFRHVGDRLRDRERGPERAGQPRGKRAQAAAERRAQAEREASQSVREIFRKLASSLHPDRERDPAERARKTELMQQVTRAYQDNDLLQLLTLQIRIEQIDAGHLAGLPDARLKHYNAVLRDQAAALDDEIAALLHPLAMEMQILDLRPRRSDLERELRARVAQLRQWCAETEDEIAALDHEQRRNDLAAKLKARFRAEEAEADLDILFGLSDEPAPGLSGGFPPGGGRRKPTSASKKRKKKKNRKRR